MTHDENYAAIMAAWMDAGPQPRYHWAMRAEVRRAMPVLAAALDRASLDVILRHTAHRPETRPTTDEDMARAGEEGHSWGWADAQDRIDAEHPTDLGDRLTYALRTPNTYEQEEA